MDLKEGVTFIGKIKVPKNFRFAPLGDFHDLRPPPFFKIPGSAPAMLFRHRVWVDLDCGIIYS